MKIDSKKKIAGSLKKHSKKELIEKKESPENKAKENARNRKSSQDNKERFKKTSSR
ncbi:MAG TPA: hypothetical protein VLD64_05060 [Nitrosarchaeum sp.]|nr:hypothetical protein [Nitrosarchaeum sp.]